MKYKEATLTYSSPQSQTLRKAARIRDLGQLGNLGARIVLGPLEHPSPLVVDDEERDSVDRVAARNRAADEVDHDVASAGLVLIAAIVGQLGQHGASDAATCEGQGSFFLEALPLRSAHTPVGERTPVQAHAIAEASGAAFVQGLQQRVPGQLFHHRAGGYVWFVGRSALFHTALLSGTPLNYCSASADSTSVRRHDEGQLFHRASRTGHYRLAATLTSELSCPRQR